MHGSYWSDVPNNNTEYRKRDIAWRAGPWIIKTATILSLCNQNFRLCLNGQIIFE
jgi:hypothetical protein